MAGKNKLSIDTGAVANAVRIIRAQLEAIEEARKYADGTALSELDPVWSGPAKDAFVAELSAFKENLNKFITAGAELNDLLDAAGKEYDKAEQNAIAKVSALPN